MPVGQAWVRRGGKLRTLRLTTIKQSSCPGSPRKRASMSTSSISMVNLFAWG